MIKHVVFFNFKDGVSEADIAELETGLGRLPAIIEEIREFVFGRDVVRSERSFDFALVSSFDDLQAMERYQVHPDHQKVVSKAREICSSIRAVDFEF